MPEVKRLKAEVAALKVDNFYLKDMMVNIASEMSSDNPVAHRLMKLAKMKQIRVECSRCNRPLKSESSMRVGMGPSCYKKHLDGIQQTLRLKAA